VARLHGGELRLEDNAPGLRAVLVLPRAGPQLQGAPPEAAVDGVADREPSLFQPDWSIRKT
jgi:hypothetical protein